MIRLSAKPGWSFGVLVGDLLHRGDDAAVGRPREQPGDLAGLDLALGIDVGGVGASCSSPPHADEHQRCRGKDRDGGGASLRVASCVLLLVWSCSRQPDCGCWGLVSNPERLCGPVQRSAGRCLRTCRTPSPANTPSPPLKMVVEARAEADRAVEVDRRRCRRRRSPRGRVGPGSRSQGRSSSTKCGTSPEISHCAVAGAAPRPAVEDHAVALRARGAGRSQSSPSALARSRTPHSIGAGVDVAPQRRVERAGQLFTQDDGTVPAAGI